MIKTLLDKLKDEAKAFVVAPIFPFIQIDWPIKMWVFIALSYVPIVNVIIARGWRMEYIHRLGWSYQRVLPSPIDILRFSRDGLLLWIMRGAFALVPVVIIVSFGLDGLIDLWNDTVEIFQLLFGYLWERTLSTEEFFQGLWNFIVTEFIHSILVVLIENIWLVIYVPVYRIGMLRFALTGRLIKSHLSLGKNLKFLFKNLIDIVFMYAFNVFNFIVVLLVDGALVMSVIGIPLIPIVTFYMYYWNSGYEYGLLARQMVEQEGLSFEIDAKRAKYLRSNRR